jgi:predicted nucleic acid-binding protein
VIILDTNVVPEIIRLAPDRQVAAWFNATHPDDVFTTAITEAELWFGVAQLPRGRRRDDVEARVARILALFRPGIISFDSAAARFFGPLAARHPDMDPLDGEIAAIALAHGATIATRNTRHFADCGVELIDPWSA